MKTCIKCGVSKPRTEFYKQPVNKDGLLGKCKDCAKAYAAMQRDLKHTEILEWQKRWRKTAAGKEQAARAQRKRRAKEPVKVKAWQTVTSAVRSGKLVRQPCEWCNSTDRVQAHHFDYTKPLDVTWLCFSCHRGKVHGQRVTA